MVLGFRGKSLCTNQAHSGVCPHTVVTSDGVYILDLAAKIDATADYICKVKWGDVEFPPPFGREAYPEASTSLLWPKPLYCGLPQVLEVELCP